jgi:DNA polymerase-4
MGSPLGIIHVDMDAFYAAVEQLDHPELRGRPVIVGGSAKARGVVSTASYEARAFGVHSAMPTVTARKLCPNGVFLPVRMERYVEFSRRIRAVFGSFTPLVEPLSLDEAFLDVRGSVRLFGGAEAIGRRIKERIREETCLAASVGIASNRFLAKLGSDYDKPDGFCVIRDAEKLAFLAPLPVSRLWGVGPAAAGALNALGAKTIADVRKLPVDLLEEKFGVYGKTIHDLSLGIAGDTVVPDGEAKSVSNETTFAADVKDRDELEGVLLDLAENVAFRLREAGLTARTVTLKVRVRPFKTLTRSETLPRPTDGTMEIYGRTRALLRAHVDPRVQPVRLVGVGTSNFVRAGRAQRELFAPPGRERAAKVDRTVDAIRRKHGDDAIRRGRRL